MNEEQLFKIILGSHVTEKSQNIGQYSQYAFKVCSESNKIQIKHAIEKLFHVAVDKVSISNVKGKKRRFGRIIGQRKGWKKAYVTLSSGHSIDFSRVQA